MARICLFDLEETLLDPRGLDGQLSHSFANPHSARRRWLAQIVQSTGLSIITERYADFTHIADAALQMVAAVDDVNLSQQDRHELLGQWRGLPAHPDVRDALERLRVVGLRLAVLTNETRTLAEAQIAHTRLHDLFEAVLCAEDVHRLMPAVEPYQMAAQHFGVRMPDLRIISAHSWQIAGALHVGCAAAFISRPALPVDPLIQRPDVAGEGLMDVAEQVIHMEGDGV
jgi:2-haloacid dehalogenase